MNITDPIYSDEEAAREHFERVNWPDGPICPHCGVIDQATKLNGESTRPGLYKCRACNKPFSVTVGTVFERSHIPLNKWLYAMHALAAGKKGTSAHQLHRELGLTYQTAWFMCHRIREAMPTAILAYSGQYRRQYWPLLMPRNRPNTWLHRPACKRAEKALPTRSRPHMALPDKPIS